MATLHLELDIDSDVHPELYVRLASIPRTASREEKLRQLAAMGLIWEVARLHGPAFSELEAATLAPSPAPVSYPREAPSVIDAGSASDHAPRVPDDVPMLVDVVDEAELVGSGVEARSPAPSHDAGPKGASRRAPVPPKPAPQPVAASPSPAPADAPAGRTRSARMKRMKESGLFQNG